MARGYLPVDRDQQFLLPPSMRDWLPEGHLAWFVLEVVERLDTSVLHGRHPNVGVGRRAYDPDMLLAVLLYAYCSGVRSSRRIERLCEVDVAFRVLAANHAPDHTTIARFRQDHEDIAVALFVDALVLCAEAGLAAVGLIAVDGTKIAANASRRANRTRAQLEDEIRAVFADAASVDAAEHDSLGTDRGDELPEDLRDARRRGARLDAALSALNARREARDAEQMTGRAAVRDGWQRRREHSSAHGPVPAEDAVAAAEAALAREQERARERDRARAEREAAAQAKGHKLGGRRQHPDGHIDVRRAQARLAKAQAATARRADAAGDAREPRVNVTDPHSRLMNAPQGWIQGYNAQAAVNAHGIVVAAHATQDPFDVHQCKPMIALTQTNLAAAGIAEPVGTMLFDAGYLSEDNITAPGPDRLIATGKAHAVHASEPATGQPPPDASPVQTMAHRLATPDGKALYAIRQHTVEPVFGDVKELRGFRRFSRRGLSAANAEWTLVMTVHNILKLFRNGTANLAA